MDAGVMAILLVIGMLALNGVAWVSGIRFGSRFRSAGFTEGKRIFLVISIVYLFIGAVVNALLGMCLAYLFFGLVFSASWAHSMTAGLVFGSWLVAVFMLWVFLEWLDHTGYVFPI